MLCRSEVANVADSLRTHVAIQTLRTSLDVAWATITERHIGSRIPNGQTRRTSAT